jgi:hypothetical protein
MTKTLEQIIIEIATALGCSPDKVERLIEITNDMERIGARFARLNKYRSDKSDHTELASHTLLLNFSYANMLKQEKERLTTVNISAIDVERFNYERINFEKKGYATVESYKVAVGEALETALAELRKPKESKDDEVSNDIWLNKVLVFNTNTQRLSIVGEEVKKVVVEQGEFKKVASDPKTTAKNLIKKQLDFRTDKYRRFAIDNIEGELKLQGETLEIGG